MHTRKFGFRVRWGRKMHPIPAITWEKFSSGKQTTLLGVALPAASLGYCPRMVWNVFFFCWWNFISTYNFHAYFYRFFEFLNIERSHFSEGQPKITKKNLGYTFHLIYTHIFTFLFWKDTSSSSMKSILFGQRLYVYPFLFHTFKIEIIKHQQRHYHFPQSDWTSFHAQLHHHDKRWRINICCGAIRCVQIEKSCVKHKRGFIDAVQEVVREWITAVILHAIHDKWFSTFVSSPGKWRKKRAARRKEER